MVKNVMTSRQIRALELNAEYFGVSRLQLMENAGRCVANEIASRFKPEKTRVCFFCGLGGNGGDGFVAARHLACSGFRVHIILAGGVEEIEDKEAKRNWRCLQSLKRSINFDDVYDSSINVDIEADVVVDALLGVGLKGPLRSPILQLVRRINEMEAFRVSIDVPTGINSDSGDVLGDAVKANLTITFHKLKPGLLRAKDYTGDLTVKCIGLPSEFEQNAGPGDVYLVATPRPPEARKGEFGRLLVMGGSEVFSGAPALVALAALRVGIDIVFIAAPEKTAYTIASMSPNLITIKLQGKHLRPSNLAVLKRYIASSSAVVIGPGLGIHIETNDAVKNIINLIEERNIPLLIDADGLKVFAKLKQKLRCPLILTPHSGEYQILTGKEPPKKLRERAADVQKTAVEFNAVILLKGHIDIISNGKQMKFNFTGNPGMTVGGTGDVLSGIIGALLARKVDPFEAAVAGAFINGAAGDFVRKEKGYHMVSTDIIDWIPRVMDDPMAHARMRESGF